MSGLPPVPSPCIFMLLFKNIFQKFHYKSVRQRTCSSALASSQNILVGTSPTCAAGMSCFTVRKFLNQEEATSLDQELFNDYKFSVDQLMELAGLSVAIAIAKVFPPTIECRDQMSFVRQNRALVICGPGNNGGDGLVAARHLNLFGFETDIFYPKRTRKTLYENLLNQCEKFGVKVLDSYPDQESLDNNYNVMVDALFGFSFKPPVREEMKPILNSMINTTVPICSVDIPSGWNVDEGPPPDPHIKPKLLISLTAPKQCAKYLNDSKHFLGGRFIPQEMQEKYQLSLPSYPGTEQVVELCD